MILAYQVKQAFLAKIQKEKESKGLHNDFFSVM